MSTQREVNGVIRLMKQQFPGCADWNVNNKGKVEILDKNDKVIGHITEEQLTKFWNRVEGF